MLEIGDWLQFAAIILDTENIIRLLFEAGIILEERPCPSPDCNGTLIAKRSRRNRYRKTNGWVYYCKGGTKYHSISILYGSIFYNSNWSLQSHMCQLFHYAMLSQRVC